MRTTLSTLRPAIPTARRPSGSIDIRRRWWRSYLRLAPRTRLGWSASIGRESEQARLPSRPGGVRIDGAVQNLALGAIALVFFVVAVSGAMAFLETPRPQTTPATGARARAGSAGRVPRPGLPHRPGARWTRGWPRAAGRGRRDHRARHRYLVSGRADIAARLPGQVASTDGYRSSGWSSGRPNGPGSPGVGAPPPMGHTSGRANGRRPVPDLARRTPADVAAPRPRPGLGHVVRQVVHRALAGSCLRSGRVPQVHAAPRRDHCDGDLVVQGLLRVAESGVPRATSAGM